MNFVHLLVFFLDLKPISAAAKRARAASFFLLIRCRRAPPPQRAIPSGGRGVEHRAGHLLTDGTYHSPRHLPPPSTHFPAHSRTLCLAPPLIYWKLSVGECVREYETQFAASRRSLLLLFACVALVPILLSFFLGIGAPSLSLGRLMASAARHASRFVLASATLMALADNFGSSPY